MGNRDKRLDMLRLVLNRTSVGSQEELLELLRAEGYKVRLMLSWPFGLYVSTGSPQLR